MARSPDLKLYRDGAYLGCIADPTDAAACAAVLKAEVRYGHAKKHLVLSCAGAQLGSYDTCALAIEDGIRRIHARSLAAHVARQTGVVAP